MTRRPPAILSAVSTAEGGVEVAWEVDSFFANSAAPEKVLIELNGVPFEALDGDATSVEVPQARIGAAGGPVLVIGVIFWWSGEPPEEQQSVLSLPVQTGGAGQGPQGVLPATKPVVGVVRVQPRTAAGPASITIAWASNNYNDGNIVWGPATAPAAHRKSIRPRGERYSGSFVTDRPLAPATPYHFRVEVRNTLHSPTWLATTVVVRSAAATLSLRAFLQASGRPASTPLASLVDASSSLRRLLLG